MRRVCSCKRFTIRSSSSRITARVSRWSCSSIARSIRANVSETCPTSIPRRCMTMARYRGRARLRNVPYLDTSAVYDNGAFVLNVVNRHPDQAIEADFEAQDKNFSGAVDVWEVNGPDIKAENDFDSTKVRAAQPSASAQGNRLAYSFPPHSYTMLKVRLV